MLGCIRARHMCLGFLAAAVPAAASTRAPAATGAGPPSSLGGTVALQLALDRAGFSPGLIDGIPGPKTTHALREFQRSRGMPATGRLDTATRAALNVDEDETLIRYRITEADRAVVGPVPKGWVEKSRLARLGYPSLAEAIAEKFHCSLGLLGRLNPGKPLSSLAVGDVVVVPDAGNAPTPPRAARLEIDLSAKMIRAYSAQGSLVGLFHCSLAARKEKLPSGQAVVEAVAIDPEYTFDPEMWPEVKGISRKLTIPPGPRNPVGVRWIGLSLPGVGIHGTPNPELIGKTGSHGCIRLTNWDAIRLSRMVSVGTPVRFVAGGSGTVADARER